MEQPGPFDRMVQTEPLQPRDRAAMVVVGAAVALGVLLLVLVLPPVSILDNGDGPPPVTGPIIATERADMPPPPEGYEAVSALFDLEAREPVRRAARLTISLASSVSADAELRLFTYQEDAWREVGEATALAEGTAARGDVPALPSNIAVFRPAQTSRLILGGLPADREFDPAGASVLTTLNPAGLTPKADGSLTGQLPAIPAGIGVDIAPTISATSAADAEAVNAIMASAELRVAHAQAIMDLVSDGPYDGIDLDYRALDPGLGPQFVSFVEALAAGLRERGATMTLTLPAPVQQADVWQTFGFDWEGLAPHVTAFKLAQEPEQDLYFARMEAALGYLVSRVGSSKLLLTMGPLSHERGVDGLRALSLTEALTLASVPVTEPEGPVAAGSTLRTLGQNLAAETGASGLRWDEAARTVAFDYTGPGGQRTVWLANAFSEAYKLDLARRYQLRGVAIEDVSTQAEEAGIWPLVRQYAETGEITLVRPNGTLLEPRWAASGGSLEPDMGASVTWEAPDAPGVYTITLIVSDGVRRVGQELEVSVESAAAQGAAAP
jgi:hypothetical protein